MMKTNKGKETLRRIGKSLYYIVHLFASGVFMLCSCSDRNTLEPDDDNFHPASISLEGTKWKPAGIVYDSWETVTSYRVEDNELFI
ncbi:MAG: hypothetical protein LBS79_09375 [Tannerella sp.]|jgi:hypothetical protein|nr:hypothetical protein [Tannerella sp.]